MNVEFSRGQVLEAANSRIELHGLLAMRCYAALSIVLVHMVLIPKLQIPSYLAFVPTHLGYGVPLFYTVSAFGLFVGYAGRLGSRSELREYYLRRFLRIAPLFYFMMIFYFPLYWTLGAKTFSLGYVISSGLFIFNLMPRYVTGYVMASWTIGVEMAFYAIFPLLVFAVTGFARSLIFLAVAVFLAVNWMWAFQGVAAPLSYFGQHSLVVHLYNFAAGIAAYYVWLALRRSPAPVGRAVFAASLLAMAWLIGFSDYLTGLLGFGVRAIWAVVLAGAVIGVSLHPARWFVNPVAKMLGNASFSLYLWHPVVIVCLDRAGLYRSIYAASDGLLAFLASIIGTFAVLIPLSLISYRYIERPGMGAAKRFSRSQPQPI